MTPEQKHLIRETWQRVAEIGDPAAQLFYERLFELDPALRPLFGRSDMAAQRRKLLQALALVVASLDRLEELLPVLQNLGRRHVGYGVRDRHYETVGAALLWTLERGLGETWDRASREAWAAAYETVSGVMRDAARAESLCLSSATTSA